MFKPPLPALHDVTPFGWKRFKMGAAPRLRTTWRPGSPGAAATRPDTTPQPATANRRSSREKPRQGGASPCSPYSQSSGSVDGDVFDVASTGSELGGSSPRVTCGASASSRQPQHPPNQVRRGPTIPPCRLRWVRDAPDSFSVVPKPIRPETEIESDKHIRSQHLSFLSESFQRG
jgi:hypothetical protein